MLCLGFIRDDDISATFFEGDLERRFFGEGVDGVVARGVTDRRIGKSVDETITSPFDFVAEGCARNFSGETGRRAGEFKTELCSLLGENLAEAGRNAFMGDDGRRAGDPYNDDPKLLMFKVSSGLPACKLVDFMGDGGRRAGLPYKDEPEIVVVELSALPLLNAESLVGEGSRLGGDPYRELVNLLGDVLTAEPGAAGFTGDRGRCAGVL